MDRSEKVAAARRKLKKYQQRSKSGTPTGSHDSSPLTVRREQSELAVKDQRNGVHQSNAKAPRVSSSKEKLQEMSTEINDILAESPYVSLSAPESKPPTTEQNQSRQLAQALQSQTALVEDLNQQLQKQASQMGELHQENIRLRHELHGYHERETSGGLQQKDLELSALREQLKVHVQTIDILVEEKSTLQSACHKHQTLVAEKSRECEELMQRLQACHKRVKDLEVISDDVTSQKRQLHQEVQQHKEKLNSLQDAIAQMTDERDDLKQEVQELERRLESQVAHCKQVEEANAQTKAKLSMSETLVQQLSSGGNSVGDLEQALRQSRDENQRLSDQLGQVTRFLQTVSVERDRLNHQLTEVAEQYEGKVQQLTAQITALTNERGTLVAHLQQQTALVKELEQKNIEVPQDASENMQQELEQLQTEKLNLSLQLEARMKESEQLRRLADEQNTEIVQLRATVKRLSDEAVDRTEMLNSIQSDKETISKLLVQNKELKAQLDELQAGFVRVTNDKMQLATDLQTYEHHNKQLQAQVDGKSIDENVYSEIADLKEQIRHFQEENLRLADRISQQGMYEMSRKAAPDPDEMVDQIERMKRELSASQNTIHQLSAENAGLQNMLLTLQNQTHTESTAAAVSTDDSYDSHPMEDIARVSALSNQEVDAVAALSARMHQLEVERNQLAQQLLQQKEFYEQHLRTLQESGHLHSQEEPAETLNGSIGQQSTHEVSLDDTISRHEYDQLELNFGQLQDRFIKVMQEKADLSDEAQRLEHLVMQLELETDTIGEYISLYHHQRDQLKARFEQKDQEITALIVDKTRIQNQVRELQRLMVALVNERQALHQRLNDQRGLAAQTLTLSQAQNESSDSETTSGDEEDAATDDSAPATSSTPVDSRERQIFDLLQELGRSSRSTRSTYTYDPSVGRVSFFPFTGSCGREVLVL